MCIEVIEHVHTYIFIYIYIYTYIYTHTHTYIYICREEGAGKFDIVVCSEVIEHVSDVAELVRQLSVLLRPGGAMMITTINR